ncbi:hypothetical protein OPQ81_010496 [Rhizoctonia solani]|nr:hypothetical protein OPQ81_010496 [Rhizoctonia solani]
MPTFNNEASLRAFPKFQSLSDRIQSIILQMLKDDRLNCYGGLKRPPNAWLIFRSDILTANPEMNSMSQMEVTARCRSRWAVATLQERMDAQARARRASDELLEYFPDYCYKPMSTGDRKRWKELGACQRRNFWLASAVRIAERIANPTKQWDGFLTLEKWEENHATTSPADISDNPSLTGLDSVHSPDMGRTIESASPPPTHLAPRLQRLRNKPNSSCVGAPNSTADVLNTPSSKFHSYSRKSSIHEPSLESHEKEEVQIQRKAAEAALPPGPLRDVLVYIGPQGANTRRRRLILSMFQLKNKMIWVSEEADDDILDDVFEEFSSTMSPDKTSPNHIVLPDYSDPWIPEAMDENGESFCPEIRSVSEYHDYMTAYYLAGGNSSDFIWRQPPHPPSPTLSPPTLPESPTPPTIPSVQAIEFIPKALHVSSLTVGQSLDFSSETSHPEMCESLLSTNHISDSDSESIKTPEDIGWDESIPNDTLEDFRYGLEGFEFNFE